MLASLVNTHDTQGVGASSQAFQTGAFCLAKPRLSLSGASLVVLQSIRFGFGIEEPYFQYELTMRPLLLTSEAGYLGSI